MHTRYTISRDLTGLRIRYYLYLWVVSIINPVVVPAGACDPQHASGDAADVRVVLAHARQPCGSAVPSRRCAGLVLLVAAAAASKFAWA